MTVKEAIARADDLRPNALDDAHKYAFLFDLEKDIAEIFGKDAPGNPYPHDAELILPFPDDLVYVLKLCLAIDYYNQDTALYQNDLLLFKEKIGNIRAGRMRQAKVKLSPTIKTI